MLDKTQHFIEKKGLFNKGQKILLATSGGVDSMVLTNILSNLGYEIILAHCNFQLRDKDADGDQAFLKAYAKKHKLKIYSKKFKTAEIAKQKKQSIQEVARVLRYKWLENTRVKCHCDFIATAHHLDDNIETLIFKLAKGTGIKGVRGILPKNDKIVRPLLEISKAEIIEYAENNNIPFREDSSNNTLKYDRNRIRKKVVPELLKINNGLYHAMQFHFEKFRNIEQFHINVIDQYRKKLFTYSNEDILIYILKLKSIKGFKMLAYELFSPFGFNATQVDNILSEKNTTEIKVIENEAYRILRDAKHLVITKNEEMDFSNILITENSKKVEIGEKQFLRVHHVPIEKLSKIVKSSIYAYIDADKLEYPLVVRKPKTSDYFYPFGMYQNGKAKKKKVSKYFKDEKRSLYEREQALVVTSGKHIVWLIGERLDDRFKITNSTQNVLKLILRSKK